MFKKLGSMLSRFKNLLTGGASVDKIVRDLGGLVPKLDALIAARSAEITEYQDKIAVASDEATRAIKIAANLKGFLGME
jgi:hypothetical protein